jgi:SNF2 family DNA or RNA helicase
MRYEFTKDSLVKLNTQIFPSKGHRISIKDLGDLFPETRILPETFTVSEATQKTVNELYGIINNALSSLKEKEVTDKGHHLTDLLRARQEIELLKIPVFVELAEDSLAENNSVVIIVNFTETLDVLSKRLNTKCVVHGSQTAQERENNIADFQSDKERIIILNIRSGGVGVSLHDLNGNHSRVSLISPSWSAQDVVQAVGRVWRAGGKSHSIQKIVYCANTVEEEICDTMKYKIDNINTINESAVSEVFASLGEEG